MALKYFAYIYLSSEFSEEYNTVSSYNGKSKFKAIGIDFKDKNKVIEIVQNLLNDGVQIVELRGGFGPTYVAEISKAINYQIPIGSVMYGPEFRQKLLEIIIK